MPDKKLTLQEFTTRLQVLCHDGYSQKELFVRFPGCALKPVSEIEFYFKSDEVINYEGLIPVKFK